jgi:hypothetical protein
MRDLSSSEQNDNFFLLDVPPFDELLRLLPHTIAKNTNMPEAVTLSQLRCLASGNTFADLKCSVWTCLLLLGR